MNETEKEPGTGDEAPPAPTPADDTPKEPA
jgi:hypothetical protein